MQTSAPRVHVHTGEELIPAERADLPGEVQDAVDAHLQMTDAREVEIRHYGDGIFTVLHRYGGPDDGCPVCGESYNHRIENGYRNQWPKDVDFAVCTPEDSDWMYVHTDGRLAFSEDGDREVGNSEDTLKDRQAFENQIYNALQSSIPAVYHLWSIYRDLSIENSGGSVDWDELEEHVWRANESIGFAQTYVQDETGVVAQFRKLVGLKADPPDTRQPPRDRRARSRAYTQDDEH